MGVKLRDPTFVLINDNNVYSGTSRVNSPIENQIPNILAGETTQFTLANVYATGVQVPDLISTLPSTTYNNAALDSITYVDDVTWSMEVTFTGQVTGPTSGDVVPTAFNVGLPGVTDPRIPTTGTFLVTYTYSFDDIFGDPQFAGFQGQQFQVHGIPDEHFNLISTPDFYLNSRFVYIATGQCNYADTECFSHPGTYMDELGLVLGNTQIRIVAGTHASGLKVYINNKPMTVGQRFSLPLSNSTYIHYSAYNQIVVGLDSFTIGATNSDMFFNLQAQINDMNLLRIGAKKKKNYYHNT